MWELTPIKRLRRELDQLRHLVRAAKGRLIMAEEEEKKRGD